MKKSKSKCYKIIRIITTLLVVLGHSAIMYEGRGVYHPIRESAIIGKLATYIYSFHMPLFFTLSGAVYAFCIEKQTYRNVFIFLWKKIKRLILPYFMWGTLYVAPVMVVLKLTKYSYLDYCYNGILLANNNRHLWFLLALFWIFVLSIIMKIFYKNLNPIMFLIISIVIAYYSKKVNLMFKLNDALYYQFFFFLGMYVNRYFKEIKNITDKIFPLLCIVPFFTFMQFEVNGDLFSYKMMYSLLGVLMVWILSIYLCNTDIGNSWFSNIINDNSMGIYILHPMILYAYYKYLSPLNFNPYIVFIFTSFSTIFISISFWEFIKKIKINVFSYKKKDKNYKVDIEKPVTASAK